MKSVKVEASEAKGVVLDTGEEIAAGKAIVSNINIKQLFLEMLKPEELPPGFQDKVRRIKQATFVPLNQHIALNEPLRFKAGGDVDKAFMVEIHPFMEDTLRMFEEYVYGIPNTRMPLVSVATLADPTRAPEGKHTLYLYHFEPYNLKDGGPARWDEIKQEVADGILDVARNHIMNLGPENILGRRIDSPLDYERHNPVFITGDFLHVGTFLPQFFANRPLPGWGQYRTPVNKLYMCGSSTHPGGGVSGGGRAAVQVIMEDLSIRFQEGDSQIGLDGSIGNKKLGKLCMAMKKGMTVYIEDGDIAAVFYSVKRVGDKLVVDAKALDAMRMDMIFTQKEIFNGLKIAFSWEVISFVLLLPYFGLKRLIRRPEKS
ncbi:MAG: hypothetical protein ABSF21_03860 [Dehalococcoidia bacterium]